MRGPTRYTCTGPIIILALLVALRSILQYMLKNRSVSSYPLPAKVPGTRQFGCVVSLGVITAAPAAEPTSCTPPRREHARAGGARGKSVGQWFAICFRMIRKGNPPRQHRWRGASSVVVCSAGLSTRLVPHRSPLRLPLHVCCSFLRHIRD